MEPFRNFIEQYTTVTAADWNSISVTLTYRDFKKGELVLKYGETCRHLYFLETGLLRYFVVDKSGNEITKYFTEAPFLFTSQRSFIKVIPSEENIECLEPCRIGLMEFSDAHRLLSLSSWSEFVRKIIQEVQHYTEQLLLEVRTTTAENRYKLMLLNSPDFIQRIPLKHLASYLGIHPQSLSRIRKQLLAADRS